MADPFIGQIEAFGFNFAPVGWATCNGQMLPISQYNALYALLGTTYGGDGVQTFALPDLCGRVFLGQGQLQGGSVYTLGQPGGSENVTLLASQMGAHSHVATVQFNGTNSGGTQQGPVGQVWAGGPSESSYKTSPTTANMGATAGATLQGAGGSQPHPNIQPYLALNYCICTEGVWPSQS